MKNTKTYEELRCRLDALEKELKGNKATTAPEAEGYATAFWEAMHTGMPVKALKKGSDGSGGFLVPDTFENEIVSGLSESNILRQLGTVIKTTADLKIPVAEKMSEATWVPEGSNIPISDVTYNEVILGAYKLAHKIIVSDELLEDTKFDLEAYIKQTALEAIREAEEEAFFCGNGKGKPLGLVYQAEVGASCDSLDTLSFDDILDLIHSLNPAYRESAVFIMSEKAENALRKIKTYRGKPVWTKGLTNELPDKLFGFPVYSTNKLYDDSNNNKPILFGDFKYLWIGDRGKRAVKRLTECYAERGQVAYMTSERVDAKLVLPEAVKALEIKE